jgi:two-component system, sensor histidine kinase PdtaS
MIRDHGVLKLKAECDDSIVRADLSLSLGLVVTELVINALKHGFPNDRGGEISVVYRSHGIGWMLSVADNGIGITHTARPGLGTSIVKAFAMQLHARIEVKDANPRTIISLIHTEAAAKDNKENATPAALAV